VKDGGYHTHPPGHLDRKPGGKKIKQLLLQIYMSFAYEKFAYLKLLIFVKDIIADQKLLN